MLFLALAISIIFLTAFLVWLLAECAILTRNVNKGIKEAREKISKIEVALTGIREKLEHSAGYLQLLAVGVKEVISLFVNRGGKKKK